MGAIFPFNTVDTDHKRSESIFSKDYIENTPSYMRNTKSKAKKIVDMQALE